MEGTGTGEETSPHGPPAAADVIVFTDIEGSVRLWQQMGDAFAPALALHNRLLRDAVAKHQGRVGNCTGDGYLFLFPDVSSAIASALQIQETLGTASWPNGVPEVRVRIAVHAGDVADLDGQCVGPAVNMAARIMQTAYGGQTLVSDSAAQLAQHEPRHGARLVDLGPHQVRDVEWPLRLYLALPAGEPVPDFIPLRALDTLPTNLPAEVAEFVGRHRELQELQALLATPGARLITLTGPGGVGKTRLMLRLGTAELDHFEDGVWLVELADVPDPGRVPAAIASQLRMPSQPEGGDPVAALGASLATKRLLLLLDNYEHLVDAALVPYELLRRAPRQKCVVTSRERLRLRGEHVFEVRPLELPDLEASPDEQRAAESVDLFCRRGARARGGQLLADPELGVVVEICRRLDGLPLALELAAARLSHLTPDELWGDLRQRLDALQSDERGVPGRLRSIRTAIEWSLELLSPDEARAFCELAVFRGGFFAEAAAAVCGPCGSPSALQQLRDKSLLRADTLLGRTRYSMLPLVQEWALERLGEGLAACHGRAARYFALWVQSVDLKGPEQRRALQLVRVELDNLRAALWWAEAAGEAAIVRDIVLAIWPAFSHEGARDECLRRLHSAVQACRDLGDNGALARLLAREAIARKLRGDVGGAQAALQEALALAEQLDLQDVRALGLMEQASLLQAAGDLERAERLFGDCLAAYRAMPDAWGMVQCLRNRGQIASWRGDHDGAEALLNEALALEDPVTRPWGVSDTLYDLGRVRLARGDTAGALAALTQSIALCREVGDGPGLVSRLRDSAETARRTGNSTAAGEALREALAAARRYCPDWVGTLEEGLKALGR